MKRMRQIQQQTNRKSIERIEVSNLTMTEVGEFIANVLKMNVEEVEPLTAAIYSKTRGNIFFAMQALEGIAHARPSTLHLPQFKRGKASKGKDSINS